jgi:bacterioferritin
MPLLSDPQTLRQRASEHIEAGAVTPGYGADRIAVIALLNAALATELVCALRYRRHHFMAAGMVSDSIAQEFLLHANEEQVHADQIARRIVQLNGAPDFDPRSLMSRSHADYVEGESLRHMIRENLLAERIAIEAYREFIQFLGDKDPTTRRLLETILATEEEHAEDLAGLLAEMAWPDRTWPAKS